MERSYTLLKSRARNAIVNLVLVPLLIAACCISVMAQSTPIKITGTIKDAKGETLIGVSLLVKGTKLGAATDIDGKYALSVPDTKAILVVSYIGYITKEVPVGDKKVVDVVLMEAESTLNEV